MNIQFEWQAGDGSGGWETIAKSERRGPPWWAWGLASVALAAALIGGYVCLA